MKRDMDLVREILLKVEETPAGQDAGSVERALPHRDPQEVLEHVSLLEQAGYLDAVVKMSGTRSGVYVAHVRGLKWDGHEFLDLARNETVWNEAKEVATKQAGSVSLEVFKAILSAVMLRVLGLGDG